jgi:molecular chaperone GrpE
MAASVEALMDRIQVNGKDNKSNAHLSCTKLEVETPEQRVETPCNDPAAILAQVEARCDGKVSGLQELLADYQRQVVQTVEATKARIARDASNQLQMDRIRLLESLLPVLDNLKLAREQATHRRADQALLDGVMLVEDQFLETLVTFGVQRYDSLGVRFDPNLHHAVGIVSTTDDGSDGIVLTELHPGYRLGDRLVRPAQVLVGQKRNNVVAIRG